AAALTQTILNNALPSSANWFVTVGIIIALIYGASSVFWELQIMLNIIWGVHNQQESNFRRVIWQRIIAIVMVILSGLLIVAGLVITLWYAEATSWASAYLNTSNRTDQLAYFIITLGLTALVFALIYKFVPDVEIAWHDVLIGATATAFLVSIARLVITLYMSYNRIGSVYGAAGSLVILLLWVYYSAQIFFLGAEFTHVYSFIYGAQRGQRTGNEPAEPSPLVVKAAAQERQPVEIEVVNLDERGQPGERTKGDRRSTETATAEDKSDDEAEEAQRGRFGLPTFSLPRKLPTLHVPKPSLPTPHLPDLRSQTRTLRSRLRAVIAAPLHIVRPIRELFMAVGVIGALSLAALFGFPWSRRLAQRSTDQPTEETVDNADAEMPPTNPQEAETPPSPHDSEA
ncbi:MAG: YihY/virulence factor BrkB family protein, partial [Caldilineaceae bacterium]|nr:YihY/virulence factor BrkB family protein [Caldilineaceae bacterium]